MVDVIGATDPSSLPGVVVQSRAEGRWRALVDLRRTAVMDIAARGLVIAAHSPVSLEDIFIALVKPDAVRN